MLQGHHQFHFGLQLEVGRDNYAQSNIASGAFDFLRLRPGVLHFPSRSLRDGARVCRFPAGDMQTISNNLENHLFAQAVVPSFTAGQQIYRALYLAIPGAPHAI